MDFFRRGSRGVLGLSGGSTGYDVGGGGCVRDACLSKGFILVSVG